MADPHPTPPQRRPPRIGAAALARLLQPAARHTGDAPWLHGEVARRMAERLPLIRQQPAQVLDWWMERSASQALLRQQYGQARIGGTDAIGQLLRPQDTSWWRKLVGAAPAVPELPVDLLWANMVLHWVEDLPPLLARWHAALQVDGFLMFSCFGPDTLRELSGLYRTLGWGPAASDFMDMHDLGDALVHAGFADPVMDMETLTLTWATPEALLAELAGLGRNTHPARHAGLRTPRWQRRLLAQLDALRGADGRLQLTFELIYGHAFRPAPRPRVAAQTQISLDDMRQMTRSRNPDHGG